MGSIEKGRGRFVWFDLNTTDPAAARAFYAKVVGWGDALWGADYHMFVTPDGKQIGGSVELSADAKAMGAPPAWLGYIGTPNVDATVKEAIALGATQLMPPMDIPEVGQFAILADPQGAVFAPFTAQGEAPGSEAAATNGEVGWHELATTDPKGALAFYGKLFGWTLAESMDMGPQGVYHLFKRPGAEGNTGGIYAKPDTMPVSNWLYYVRVDDLKKATEAIGKNGGNVMMGPIEVPGDDTILVAMDPQGAVFALVSRTVKAS